MFVEMYKLQICEKKFGQFFGFFERKINDQKIGTLSQTLYLNDHPKAPYKLLLTYPDYIDDGVDVDHGFDLVVVKEILQFAQPFDHSLDISEQFVDVSLLGSVQLVLSVFQPEKNV